MTLTALVHPALCLGSLTLDSCLLIFQPQREVRVTTHFTHMSRLGLPLPLTFGEAGDRCPSLSPHLCGSGSS